MGSYLADWAPKCLKTIKKAFHDITYEVVRAASRDISVSYTGFSLQALLEYRTKAHSIRVMLKVSTPPPDGKVRQASSYGFSVLPTGEVTKKYYLNMDMLRILTRICDHTKADLALIKKYPQVWKPFWIS